MSSLFGGGDVDMPSVQAEQPRRTAERVDQLSEQKRKNRRAAASMLTKDWSKPKLGTAGMLGL